nr:DNA cytosine methyltransferase [Caenimonas sp. SL110]
MFAGCGGFSCGLERAGFRGVLHVEQDEWACETLSANFDPATVLCSDVRNVSDEFIRSYRGVDLIVGGPPCQGFSVAGSSQFGVHDPRNELVLWYLKWVEVIRPAVCVIENVPGILGKRDQFGKTVPQIVLERLGPLGYSVRSTLLNAGAFGVPQLRTRAFILCERHGRSIADPAPTHGLIDDRVALDLFDRLQPHVTVGEAISDIPFIGPGEGAEQGLPYIGAPSNDYQRLMRGQETEVRNHVAMKHTRRLIERFAAIQEEQSLKDVGETHGQLRNGSGEVNSKPFKYNNYRLAWARPALTIPASFQSLFVHPKRNRNLTAREAARLMSFPDSFVFCGKRTTMSWEKHLSQYNQIGNAVCPLVAQVLGESLQRWFEGLGVEEGTTRFVEAAVDAPPSGAFLQRAVHSSGVPTLDARLRAELRAAFAAEIGDDKYLLPEVVLDNLPVPSEAFPVALILLTQKGCSICNAGRAPFGEHLGVMPFLISKDELRSLELNENDHGLDYHLRALLSVDHQIAHVVGEQLVALGFGSADLVTNPRTGRTVKGIRSVECPKYLEPYRAAIFGLQRAANPKRRRLTPVPG